jgi:hypothetical protein
MSVLGVVSPARAASASWRALTSARRNRCGLPRRQWLHSHYVALRLRSTKRVWGLLPGDVAPAADALLGHATSKLSPDAMLNSSSLQWRAFENEEAFNSLAQARAWVGLGNTYRGITTHAGEAAGYHGAPLNGFMHNSYLYIAVKTGLQGLAAFLWFCAAFLFYAGACSEVWPTAPTDGWC